MANKEIGLPNDKMSDDAIINLYWDRNEKAIEATDKKYRKYLYAISYNILKNRLDIEECINDTYLTTWDKIPPERPNVFQRFLSKITRDISIDKYRKNHADRRIPSELTVSLNELDACMAGLVTEEEHKAVIQISSVLNSYLYGASERDRFIFVCRYYYSDSVKEIARMLNVSDKTVYRDLVRMREELRAALLKEGIVI